MRGTIVAFLIVAGSLAWRAAPAVAADPEPRTILAPTGVLRAASIRARRLRSCSKTIGAPDATLELAESSD
jgi:hypothetical protein